MGLPGDVGKSKRAGSDSGRREDRVLEDVLSTSIVFAKTPEKQDSVRIDQRMLVSEDEGEAE